MAFLKAIRMARPTQREGSRAIYFRERIPADVLDRVRGLTLRITLEGTDIRVAVRIGPKAEHVKLSLRTSEKVEGTRRHAAVAADLAEFYQTLRATKPYTASPKATHLTHPQAVKLSEAVYRGAAEDDLGSAVYVGEVEFEIPETKTPSATAPTVTAGGTPAQQGEHPATASNSATWRKATLRRHERGLQSVLPDPMDIAAIWASLVRSADVEEGAEAVHHEAHRAGRLGVISADKLGAIADRILASRGLTVDETSREVLLHEIERSLRDGFERRRHNAATGDYTPDPRAERFNIAADLPSTASPPPSRITTTAENDLSLSELFDRWKLHPEQQHMSPSTIASYATAFRLLGEFLKKGRRTGTGPIARADIDAFIEHLSRTGMKLRTVRDNRLACLKSVFRWAAGKRLIEADPTEGVRIKVRLEPGEGSSDRGFTNAEAQAILRHAANYRPSQRENPKVAAAKRWLPWLCAYTGTRVGEMAQLRKQDVIQGEDGHWALRITHDAGTNKRKMTWEVPLHPHLIEQGFLDFVRGSAEGKHLFLSPKPRTYAADAKDSKTKDPRGILQELTTVRNRVAEFVRGVVPKASGPGGRQVPPNHGWRHRFKTVGREHGIEGIVLDAFAKHAAKTVSDGYGTVTMKTMRHALEKMPRYDVN